MDIAAAATAILPFVVKDLTSGSQELMKLMSADLYNLIKSKFSKPHEQELLNQAAEVEDTEAIGAVKFKLKEALAENPSFAAEIQRILPDLKANQSISQKVKGNGNIAFQNSNNNSINVNHSKISDDKSGD